MATAADTISSTIDPQDLGAFQALHARFAKTIQANVQTRRERLAIIIEGFRLFQAIGGYSSPATHELYAALGINTRMNDPRKAAMAITGEFPAREGNPTKSNRMYGRIRTTAGILITLEKDYPAGSAATVDEIIDSIERSGGWRSYGKKGDNAPIGPEQDRGSAGNTGANTDNGHGPEQPTNAGEGDAAKRDDDIIFDVAGCRTLIERLGITATPSSALVAPTPRVALICGADETALSILPLTGVPVDLLKELQEYRPDPDEHASKAIKAWGYITTALQLFDRLDSAVPVDPDVEPYVGQDMKPSLPGIVCQTSDRVVISASRQRTSMVVSVATSFQLVAKGNLRAQDCWMHGKGTSSLIGNLSSAEHRAAYLDPELVADGSKVKFKVRRNHGTDRKDFVIDLRALKEDAPDDYWLLVPFDNLHPATSATFEGELAAQTDLLKFAAMAGAAKSLTKNVKVAISAGKEPSFSLALGLSKRNVIAGCSVEGPAQNCEVAAQDFARAMAFGHEIRGQGCKLAIEPNGLLLVSFDVHEIGQFQVAIPTLHEGKRQPTLLKRVPR